MKKILIPILIILLITNLSGIPVSSTTSLSQDFEASFLFEVEGIGYSYPYRTQFILGFEIIVWYSQEGLLKSYVPEYELTLPYLGVSIAFIGIWSATPLLNQPGELSGFIAGPTLIVTNFMQ